MGLLLRLLQVVFCFSSLECSNRPPSLRAVFLGNSLSGGFLVGNSATGREAKPHPRQIPSGVLGDVPGKILRLANQACVFHFSYFQNLQSDSSLEDHDDPTKYGLVTDLLVRDSPHDVLIVQPRSYELFERSCEANSSSLLPALNIFNRSLQSSPSAKRIIFETWAEYGYRGSENRTDKQELCMFASVLCTTKSLIQSVNQNLFFPSVSGGIVTAPVGEAWRYVGNLACKKVNACPCPALDLQRNDSKCGYVSSECADAWSNTGKGLFMPNASNIHATDDFGAWLAALVLYGTIQSPPCIPPKSLLERVGVIFQNPDLIHVAAADALSREYGSLAECPVNFDASTPENSRVWIVAAVVAFLAIPVCIHIFLWLKTRCFVKSSNLQREPLVVR